MMEVSQYPFLDSDKPFYCKKGCGRLLRYSAMHDRVYEISGQDCNELLSTHKHRCPKKKVAKK